MPLSSSSVMEHLDNTESRRRSPCSLSPQCKALWLMGNLYQLGKVSWIWSLVPQWHGAGGTGLVTLGWWHWAGGTGLVALGIWMGAPGLCGSPVLHHPNGGRGSMVSSLNASGPVALCCRWALCSTSAGSSAPTTFKGLVMSICPPLLYSSRGGSPCVIPFNHI